MEKIDEILKHWDDEEYNFTPNDYFVARDKKYDSICIRGKNDRYKALKSRGKWTKGYPSFDDLMDCFSELKNNEEIIKILEEVNL